LIEGAKKAFQKERKILRGDSEKDPEGASHSAGSRGDHGIMSGGQKKRGGEPKTLPRKRG